MGEYNQPRAHFSPRKVKKLKSRGYDIPPPNMEPLPTPNGRRRACLPRGADVCASTWEQACAPPQGTDVRTPIQGAGVRASLGRRHSRPPPYGGAGVRAPSLPCVPSVHL
jgi:hypothetical protein